MRGVQGEDHRDRRDDQDERVHGRQRDVEDLDRIRQVIRREPELLQDPEQGPDLLFGAICNGIFSITNLTRAFRDWLTISMSSTKQSQLSGEMILINTVSNGSTATTIVTP